MAIKSLIELTDDLTDLQESDLLYVRRNSGVADQKITGSRFRPSTITVVNSGSIDLSTYVGDLIIEANGTSLTITFTNQLKTGRILRVLNKNATQLTLAGTVAAIIYQNTYGVYGSDGTTMRKIFENSMVIGFSIDDTIFAATGLRSTMLPVAVTLRTIEVQTTDAIAGASLVVVTKKNGTTISKDVTLTVGGASLVQSLDCGVAFAKNDRLSFDTTGAVTAGGNPLCVNYIFS